MPILKSLGCWWAGGEDGVFAVKSNCGFLTSLVRPWGCMGMCLLRWGLGVGLQPRLTDLSRIGGDLLLWGS